MESSRDAQQRLAAEGGPALFTDWRDAVFFHLAVPPEVLQPQVPFPLDLYEGDAYVSIVAFDQRRLRTPLFHGLPTPIIRRLGSSLFCNLRTYVRYAGERGVFFLREWIPNPMSALLVPLAYGPPQRTARLRYEHDRRDGIFFGQVTSSEKHLDLLGRIDYAAPVAPPPPGSLDDFLLERYTAFTVQWRRRLRFHIWHRPWPQHPITGEIPNAELLRDSGSWYDAARLAHGNYSPGVDGVWIGRPLSLP